MAGYRPVQFRLLREDFISPLRKGISDHLDGKVGRDLRNIKVYEGVQIMRPVFTSLKVGLCHALQFDSTPIRYAMHWDPDKPSKHFMYGALLCLSPDRFQKKIFFATVSKSQDLMNGCIEAVFQVSGELLYLISRKTEFVMVEPQGYFEAYRHILHSMQVSEIPTMPFTSHLVTLSRNPGKVCPPKYITTAVTYDIECLVNKECRDFTNVNITNFSQWPTLQMTGLDKSQFEAIQMALTQEVAVIQGPPGTGKTFIGLKIVQALLKNRHVWNKVECRSDDLMGFRPPFPHTEHSPILVMCVTNHALDQFLEGILDMHEGEDLKLIRIGGQSKSERLQECSLYNTKRRLRNVPQPEYTAMKDRFEKARKEGEALSREIRDFEDPKSKFIGFDEIKCVIDQHHYQSLLEFAETAEEEQIAMELWLGLYVNEVYEEYVPVEQVQNRVEDRSNFYGPSTNTTEGSVNQMTEMFEEMKLEGKPQCTSKSFIHEEAYILKKRIVKASAMLEKDVDKVNIFNLNIKDRYKLYMYWHKKYRDYLLDQLEDHCKVFNQKCQLADEARKMTERHPLESTDVIGMTTTGAGKYRHILDMVSPKIVIVEEAAEVLESHIVSALNAGTQHLILIGDHKQLRPKTNEYDMEVEYNLHISLFERLVKNNFPHTTLKIQHRMRPEIADLVRNHIYGSDVLCDDKSVKSFPKIRGICSNAFFIQHTEPEKVSDRSRSNSYEASYLSSLCKFLLQQGYETSQITVIVTYSSQLQQISNSMGKSNLNLEDIQVTTVDSFQGEENDIILLSLVRSNQYGDIGFLKTENRVCVALSRAKHGFYCIGNFNMLRKGAGLWEEIVSDMERKGRIGESLMVHCNRHPQYIKGAKYPGDFEKHFPHGGCSLPCEFRLKCGHICALTCHSSDPEHEKYICRYKVRRTMPGCQHWQEMQCCQDPERVECEKMCVKTFPVCGHSQEMRCNQRPEYDNVSCNSKCEKSCPKGHPCPLLCSQRCQPCRVLSKIRLPVCGHMQEKFCHQDIADIQCKARCEKECKLAGHPCPLKCHQACGQCRMMVTKTLACGHTTKIQCSESSADLACREPCTNTLRCGHKCPSTCGQPCLNEQCTESIEITLRCSHKFWILCSKKNNVSYRLTLACSEPCRKKLPCGHACTGNCSASCTKQCNADVNLICPQGHSLLRKCFETLDSHPCDKKCRKKLSCGHPCQNPCSKRCSIECNYPYSVDYPCGHKLWLSCSASMQQHPCDVICRALLACGHTCRGKCSDCGSTRIHKPCEYSVTQRHFCGEEIEMKCVGLRDPHTSKAAKQVTKYLHCTHITIPYVYDQCATAFYKCHKPCQWSCPHHRCTKLCHELCSRPPCDEKCLKTMGCGKHRCIGLCGELCIRFCPLCDSKAFSSKLVSSRKFSNQQVYTQLPCGHIFTVQDMDKHVADRPSSVVGPLHCPECSSPLSCSFRYGNLVKESISHVEAVKAKVKSQIFSLSAEEKERLNCMYSQQKLNRIFELFPKLHTCVLNFIKKLRYHDSIISKEEGFLYFVVFKVISFSSNSKHINSSQFPAMLENLESMIKEETPQLSYQIIQDITSELNRLYLLSLTRSPKLFADLTKEIEVFRPSILNGCWKRCPSHHYYCVPVSKLSSSISVQCPECTGT